MDEGVPRRENHDEGVARREILDESLVQLAREAFALFDKNNSGNIDQKV